MIRHLTMDRDDLGRVLDWAAAEGWNPGLEDADAFLAADPGGFFLAVEDGAPLAAVSVVTHSPDFAFLGLYLCRPDRRGQGIGRALWDHAMRHAGDRVVGLDGVLAQQENYALSGFRRAGVTTRFEGQVTGQPCAEVTEASAADAPRLIAAEAAASGWSKAAYLSAWVAPTATRRTFILPGGAFATARRCRSGCKIGPLLAANAPEAETLIRHAAATFGPRVAIDVPDAATVLSSLCAALGLAGSFETCRMYRNLDRSTPDVPGVFAVATLELG